MANKNTRRAKKLGFCSQKDAQSNGNKVFSGACCDTSWQAKACKRNGPKVYKDHE